VGAARERRAQERLDDDELARRRRIRAAVDGIIRCTARRYDDELGGISAFWARASGQPRDVG
jgi:hypothetical protein